MAQNGARHARRPFRPWTRIERFGMKQTVLGHGRPLLFLHDWGFNAESWRRQLDFFQTSYRLHVIDYNVPSLPAEVGHERLPAWLTEGLAAALPQPPYGIVAHGFGAFLAYELIERGLVPQKLVLVGGVARFTNGEDCLSGLPQSEVARMRAALRTDTDAMLRDYYAATFNGRHESAPADLRDCVPLAAGAFLRCAFDALISHDYRDVVRQVDCPTLILQGEADRISPCWQGMLLRSLIRGSVLEICKGTGHAPFLTQYASTNRRIARFLDQPAVRSGTAAPGTPAAPGAPGAPPLPAGS